MRDTLSDVAGENLAFVRLDISDEAQTQAAVDEAVKQFGRIDVLVNNAGYSLLANFEEMTTAEIESQFATNFYGVVYVMRAAVPVSERFGDGVCLFAKLTYCFWPELLRCFVVCSVTLKLGGTNSVVSVGSRD